MFPIIIIFLLLYFGINGWLFYSLLQSLSPLPLAAKVAISAIYWLLTLSFFIIQFYRHRQVSSVVYHHIYQISTSWIVVVLYMALFYGCFSLLRHLGISIHNDFFCSIILTVAVLIYGNINFNNPKVKHLDIELQQKEKLTSPTRIVAFSDVHLGYGINRKRLELYVRLINNENPDIILIGGDLIDMSVVPLWNEKMYEPLNQLHAPSGIYMVMGNHDYMSGLTETTNFIKQTPITLLRDSAVLLPSGLQIIGNDDNSNQKRKSIAELMQLVNKEKPIIYVAHQPDNNTIDRVAAEEIDFAFFGHTHRGQFFPINLVVKAMYQHSYGYKTINNSHFFVSSGLGLWGPPFRIGSSSEIVVIDIK